MASACLQDAPGARLSETPSLYAENHPTMIARNNGADVYSTSDQIATNENDAGTESDGASPSARTRTRQRELDQFYTNEDVARRCMERIHEQVAAHGFEPRTGTWLEPSAGTGVFLELLPQPRMGLDLEPKHAEIKEADFLKWKGSAELQRPVTVVGNPPFGRNASLALQFMRKALEFSDLICFILPRTFEKQSMQDKVDSHLHLLWSETLPANSFTHNEQPYDVPCCFQIWYRDDAVGRRRRQSRTMEHHDFDIIGDENAADFAFQRVGARAGRVSKEGLTKSWKSHYFIKVRDPANVQAVSDVLKRIDWKTIRGRTAGNPSIGKSELFAKYAEELAKIPGRNHVPEVRQGQNWKLFD